MPRPAAARRSAGSLVRRALQLDAAAWLDLARATRELGLARLRLATSPPADIIELAKRRPRHEGGRPDAAEQVQRVRAAIGIANRRVPWRADCLVQALAARHWLGRKGIASELFIGVRKDAGGATEAHAWLMHGGSVVTGGDVAGFEPLVTPEVLAALSSQGANKRP